MTGVQFRNPRRRRRGHCYRSWPPGFRITTWDASYSDRHLAEDPRGRLPRGNYQPWGTTVMRLVLNDYAEVWYRILEVTGPDEMTQQGRTHWRLACDLDPGQKRDLVLGAVSAEKTLRLVFVSCWRLSQATQQEMQTGEPEPDDSGWDILTGPIPVITEDTPPPKLALLSAPVGHHRRGS